MWGSMKEYEVLVHRKVDKFLEGLKERNRMRILKVIRDLGDYPFVLKRYDIKKIKGRGNTYRLRIGDLRLIFHADKEHRRIVVSNIGYRGKIY